MGKQSKERFDSWLEKTRSILAMDEREIGIPPAFIAVRGATKISLSKCHLAMRRSQTLVSWFATGIFSRETLLESNEKTYCSALRRKSREKARFFSDRPRRRRAVHARAVHAFVAPRGGFARAVVERDETSASARRARRRRRWRARA
jgi:hypothetical protein